MKGLITERDAEIVVMRYQDATPTDIARRYSITVATVAHHLRKLEDVTLEQALQRLQDLARIDQVVTVRRWSEALSKADTSKLLARDLRDLQTAIDKGPTAPTPARSPKSAKKPANKGNSPKLFKV